MFVSAGASAGVSPVRPLRATTWSLGAANQQTASVVVRVRADFDTACEDIVWSGKNVSPSSSNARLTGPGALTVETIVGRHMTACKLIHCVYNTARYELGHVISSPLSGSPSEVVVVASEGERAPMQSVVSKTVTGR